MKMRRWIRQTLLIFLVTFVTAACASYPDEPRNPEVKDNYYEVEEDGFLAVSSRQGILVDDKPKEGTQAILVTLGPLETENGGHLVLAEDGSFVYEPKENFSGQDQFTYTVKNEKNKRSNGKIFFDVKPVNDPPMAVDDEISISSQAPTVLDLLANDVDPDGDPMTITQVSTANSGAVTLNGDGSVGYTPSVDHSGVVQFSYSVEDGNGERASAWVLLTISNPVNNILAEPDTIPAPPNTPVTIAFSQLLANDSGSDLAVREAGEARNGTIINNGNDTLTYTPNAGFSGSDTFVYTISGRNNATSAAVVTVAVGQDIVTGRPTISDIADQTTAVNTRTDPIIFTIGDPDTPVENLSVTAVVTQATPPDLVVQEDIVLAGLSERRALWIHPNENLYGTATITVTVSDGQNQASDTFVLTVDPSGEAPTISDIPDQSTEMNQPTPEIAFTVNDAQTSSRNLTVTGTSSNQILVPDANIHLGGRREQRTVSIVPADQQIGETTITISVSDGTFSAQDTFILRVGTSGPSAPPQIINVDPGRNLQVNTPFTLNFTVEDPDTPPANLIIRAISLDTLLIPNDTAHIAIGGDSDPSGRRTLTLTPAGQQTGAVTVVLSVTDGVNRADLSLLFQIGNSPPVIAPIADQSIRLYQTLDLPLHVTDETPPDQLGFRLRIRSNVSDIIPVETVSFPYNQAGGYRSLNIRPPHGEGTATLLLTAIDASGLESETQFQITIGRSASLTGLNLLNQSAAGAVLNAGGQLEDQSILTFQTQEDSPLMVAATQGLLADALNMGGRAGARIIAAATPSTTFFGGQVQVRDDGAFVYTPPANFSGRDRFEYTFEAGGNPQRRQTETAIVVVTEVDDAPLTEDDFYTVAPGQKLMVGADRGVLENDRDVEDHPLRVLPQNSSGFHLYSDGGFSFTPQEGFKGRKTIVYTVSDGNRTATGMLILSTGSEDALFAAEDDYRAAAGKVMKVAEPLGLLANDRTLDGQPLFLAATGVFETLFGGEVHLNKNGAFNYISAPNFDGFDSFTYTLTDGRNQATGIAVISVTP